MHDYDCAFIEIIEPPNFVVDSTTPTILPAKIRFKTGEDGHSKK